MGSEMCIRDRYEIDNSLRGSDSGKLSRTPSSAGNRQTFTISTWVKLSRIEHVFPIYNVGTGVRTSLKEIAEKLLKLTRSENLGIQYAPRSSATLVKNRIGCPLKAKAEINFSAEVGLDEGLMQLIEWRAKHKQNNLG